MREQAVAAAVAPSIEDAANGNEFAPLDLPCHEINLPREARTNDVQQVTRFHPDWRHLIIKIDVADQHPSIRRNNACMFEQMEVQVQLRIVAQLSLAQMRLARLVTLLQHCYRILGSSSPAAIGGLIDCPQAF